MRGWILVAFREPRNMLAELSKADVDALYEGSQSASDFVRAILTKQGGLRPLYLADQQWSPGYAPPASPQYACWVVDKERAHVFGTRKACEDEAERWAKGVSYFLVRAAYTDETGDYFGPGLGEQRARQGGGA